MSMQMWAFLPAGVHLTRHAWQAGIDGLDLALQLDPAVDPASASGFFPMALAGRQAGMELMGVPAEEVLDCFDEPEQSALRAGIPQGATALEFTWGGNFLELASACGAAAGLVAAFNAVVFDGESGAWLDQAALLESYKFGLAEGLKRG